MHCLEPDLLDHQFIGLVRLLDLGVLPSHKPSHRQSFCHGHHRDVLWDDGELVAIRGHRGDDDGGVARTSSGIPGRLQGTAPGHRQLLLQLLRGRGLIFALQCECVLLSWGKHGWF